jgi:hypothetical protein
MRNWYSAIGLALACSMSGFTMTAKNSSQSLGQKSTNPGAPYAIIDEMPSRFSRENIFRAIASSTTTGSHLGFVGNLTVTYASASGSKDEIGSLISTISKRSAMRWSAKSLDMSRPAK